MEWDKKIPLGRQDLRDKQDLFACGETLLARRPLYLVILLILSDFCFLFREAVNTFLSASICVGRRLIYSLFLFLIHRRHTQNDADV